jgi:hypothetical protein
LRTHGKHTLASTNLCRHAKGAEFVRNVTFLTDWQRPGAASATAGVELHAQQTQSIDPDANRSFGIAGVEAQHETLSPLFQLVFATGRVIP